MNIETLREKFTKLDEALKARGDEKRPQFSSKEGPIGISIVRSMLEHLEAQDARIAELERKLGER